MRVGGLLTREFPDCGQFPVSPLLGHGLMEVGLSKKSENVKLIGCQELKQRYCLTRSLELIGCRELTQRHCLTRSLELISIAFMMTLMTKIGRFTGRWRSSTWRSSSLPTEPGQASCNRDKGRFQTGGKVRSICNNPRQYDSPRHAILSPSKLKIPLTCNKPPRDGLKQPGPKDIRCQT